MASSLLTDINDWDSALRLGSQSSAMDFETMTRASSRSDDRFSPGVLTPPDSSYNSPVDDRKVEGNACISVSTTFFPGANIDSVPIDLIIVSSDSVFFYVQSQRLLSASDNEFNSHLPIKRELLESDPILTLPESSSVLNIVLHTIYNMSCSHYSPSLADLSAAITALKVYGVPLQTSLAPGTPLSTTLLSYAPTNPLELYAIASAYGLHEIAVSTSPHLLSYSLPSITDDMATRIGAVYLKKLFFLHLGRIEALKRLILTPPHPHAPTPTCDFVEQKKLTRAWALASAYITWDVRPDMSASTIESALCPLVDHLSCDVCKVVLRDRIKDVVVQWSVVKRTI
ncbi:hypothetical protein EW145_g4600 [Phellinidium pouzarii]|uniref:BTB domain-containing protein n=1 Tax=Phellinidium pouzarii TaxID=167371 RepID=A0A4S4L4R4_9AGAM|nr:hypothetical protein EW145_g4600 [Phellinidium pouzarii]